MNEQHAPSDKINRYREQLQDARWEEKRQLILERDQNKCRCCSLSQKLQVHHRQYHYCQLTGEWKAPWDYDNALLVALCKDCHKSGHEQFKVPYFPIVINLTKSAKKLHAW